MKRWQILKEPLLPRLITKQMNMLYGRDQQCIKQCLLMVNLSANGLVSGNHELDCWKDRGLESDYKEVAKALIKELRIFVTTL